VANTLNEPVRSTHNPKAIDLHSLGEGMAGLTSACGTSLAESAAVCLEDRSHTPGVFLSVKGISNAGYVLQWIAVDDQQRRCYNDLQEATERGAYAVAILLVRQLTGMTVLQRSKKGPGFDYWVGEPDDNGLLFQGKTRLEVSGLLEGSTTEITARVKRKIAQVKPSDHLAPAYIAVVEFGAPTAQVVHK
jgi:hypothetical protein